MVRGTRDRKQADAELQAMQVRLNRAVADVDRSSLVPPSTHPPTHYTTTVNT